MAPRSCSWCSGMSCVKATRKPTCNPERPWYGRPNLVDGFSETLSQFPQAMGHWLRNGQSDSQSLLGTRDDPNEPAEAKRDDVGADNDDGAESQELVETPNALEVATCERESNCREYELLRASVHLFPTLITEGCGRDGTQTHLEQAKFDPTGSEQRPRIHPALARHEHQPRHVYACETWFGSVLLR